MSSRHVSGIGIGLRLPFAAELLNHAPSGVQWLEVHPENYVSRGGRYESALERCAARWPIVAHGLTLGFGATEPFERDYTTALRTFLERYDVPWYSDHLCFSSVDGLMLHDLLPLPATRETVRTVARRCRELQGVLERPVAIENVSYYATLGTPEMSEPDLICEILEAADAKLLLDVNNVFVNSINHGFDPRWYMDQIPPDRVVQIHVAGHLVRPDGLIIDTHAEPVCRDVFELLEYALRRLGPVPVLLERDGNYPPLETLLEEVRELQTIYSRATGRPELSAQVHP